MKNILVPCDFSKQAINAFQIALDIAAQSKGIVHVLNVVELPVLHDSILMPVLNFEEELIKELKQKSYDHLKKIVEKYNNTEPKKVMPIVQLGAVLKTIQDYIGANNIDMVVMGSHGTSGVSEFFIGSNAEKIVRNSTVPVLVVKEYYKGPIKKIIFPNTLDTEHQEDLVMQVKALQNFFKAHLQIVYVNTPTSFASDITTNKRLQAFLERFMFKDYSTHIVNSVEEERGILEFASASKTNLIALGTHGRKGVARLLNGSLAEDVANHSNGLVWTYSLKNELAMQEN